MTPRTNDGFTLIELIVVIAVLAILAAVALPKFADFSTSAENAAFDGVVGGFTAGIGITHAKWLADNKPTVGVFLDGATVQVNAAGWPTLDSAGAGTQGTADELWGLVMAGSTPSGWTALSTDHVTAVSGLASYKQIANGSCMLYVGATGRVCQTTNGTCPTGC